MTDKPKAKNYDREAIDPKQVIDDIIECVRNFESLHSQPPDILEIDRPLFEAIEGCYPGYLRRLLRAGCKADDPPRNNRIALSIRAIAQSEPGFHMYTMPPLWKRKVLECEIERYVTELNSNANRP